MRDKNQYGRKLPWPNLTVPALLSFALLPLFPTRKFQFLSLFLFFLFSFSPLPNIEKILILSKFPSRNLILGFPLSPVTTLPKKKKKKGKSKILRKVTHFWPQRWGILIDFPEIERSVVIDIQAGIDYIAFKVLMVCTLRSQRMAALARLLTSSQATADDFGHKKLASQYIHRELWEADEANLIDEKDMHVFDLQPMTDPLHLVCCNACRKPIKASQYAVHAELCSSLTSTEEIGLELDGGPGNKKPVRKDRKKFLAVNSYQTATVIDQEKFEILDASDRFAPETHLEAPAAESKNGPAILDGLGTGPQNTNFLGSATSHPKKRAKLSKADGPSPILDHLEAANGAISQETLICGGHHKRSTTESQKISITCQMSRQLEKRYMLNKDIPVPLATKIYYSQQNQRMRSALSYMYCNTSAKEHSIGLFHEKIFQSKDDQTLTPSPNSFSSNQVIDH